MHDPRDTLDVHRHVHTHDLSPYCGLRIFGSSASRSPSPNTFNASIMVRIARPGKIATCGASWMYCLPSLSIAPHSGDGGRMPRPRKLRLDAVRIAVPSLSVAITNTGAIAFGRRW